MQLCNVRPHHHRPCSLPGQEGGHAAGLLFSPRHPNSFAAMCLSDGRTDGVGPAAFPTLKPLPPPPPPRRSQMKVRGKENQQREGRQSGRRQIKRSGGEEAVATVSQSPPSSSICVAQFQDDPPSLRLSYLRVRLASFTTIARFPRKR